MTHTFEGADPLECEICGMPAKNRRHVGEPPVPVRGGRPARSTRNPAPSHTAATLIAPHLGSIRHELLQFIAGSMKGGHTDDELEVLTGRPHQSVSSTRNGLVNDGWLKPASDDDGGTLLRHTRSGFPATVWTLTVEGKAHYQHAPTERTRADVDD